MKGLIKRAVGYERRKRSSLFGRRTVNWIRADPWVSFTFDDFPRSAYLRGGKILEKYRIRGSYYASLGLLGGDSPSGDLFTLDELEEAIAHGHEIGSHTYDHREAWNSSASDFRTAILKNQEALQSIFPKYAFRTLSYPITQPHPLIKKLASEYFVGCRGGGQAFNGKEIDLNLLKSCFIDKRNRENIAYFAKLIERNSQDKGWLIFSTHDLDEKPSDYGCHPYLFEKIVELSIGSLANILPVCEVLSRITE